MIKLSKQCGHMDGVWIYAGHHAQALISDGGQPRVNRTCVRRCNRGKSTLIQLTLFKVAEVEGAVAGYAGRFVSKCRAVTSAPSTTAPDGSLTRPLKLA